MKPVKDYSQLTFLTKFKELFFKPKNFFKLIKSEKGIKKAFLVSLLAYFIFLIWYLNIIDDALNVIISITGITWQVSVFFLGLAGLSFFFIFSFFLKVFAKILGSKNSFEDFYKMVVYAYVPYALFGFIPLMPLWSIILNIIGIKSVTNFSNLKSIGLFILASTISTIILIIPISLML